MSQKEKPLELSMNGQLLVSFRDMPEDYVIINRFSAWQYDGAQQIFNENPSAKTLMILYGDQGLDNMSKAHIRSVYQSPELLDDNLRRFPEEDRDPLHYVSGEKLIKLDVEVGCDLSAYGHSSVMVPQLAEKDEIRRMAAAHIESISSHEDPFEFAEDWGNTEGLRITRLYEPKNRENIVAKDIPVELNASKFGEDIFYMLSSAERGTIIPDGVFMAAAAKQGQNDGASFNHEFIEKLEISASAASALSVYTHMDRNEPLKNPMIVLNHIPAYENETGLESYEIAKYRAGSVLRGDPECPNEYRLFQDKHNDNRFVLAGVVAKDVAINGRPKEDWYIKKGMMHVIETDLSSSHTDRELFDKLYSPVTNLDMFKHFGYNVDSSNKPESPSRSTGITPS